MIEVKPHLFVGRDTDVAAVGPDWYVLHCAKSPWHANMVGYPKGQRAPAGEERLVARRGNRMALNMIDADSAEFFANEMVDAGLRFIDEAVGEGAPILVHCNQGQSRGPSIALLWMVESGQFSVGNGTEEMIESFRYLYPDYSPARGIREYLHRRLP